MKSNENRNGLLSLFLNIKLSKFSYLLISLVLLLIVYPFFEGDQSRLELLFLLIVIIQVAGLYAISYTRTDFIIGTVLGLLWLLSSLAYWFFPMKIDFVLSIFFGVLFLVFTTFIILYHVLQGQKVTVDTLFGAICVFILIGIIWSGIYFLLNTISPGSFLVSEAYNYTDSSIKWSTLLFYSYSTYTPMSNSAIYPATSYAESAASLEAIFGHLYVVMLVARLVGLYIINFRSDAEGSNN